MGRSRNTEDPYRKERNRRPKPIEERLTICDGLNKTNTQKKAGTNYKGSQQRQRTPKQKDEETCTSEMNDKANEVRNAKIVFRR